MAGTALVMDYPSITDADCAAWERNNAAEWALLFVGWVAEWGFSPHAESLFEQYRLALVWAERFEKLAAS